MEMQLVRFPNYVAPKQKHGGRPSPRPRSLRRCRITDAEDHHDAGGFRAANVRVVGVPRASLDAPPVPQGAEPWEFELHVGVPVNTGAL